MADNHSSTAGTQQSYPNRTDASQAGKDAQNIGKHNDSLANLEKLHNRVHGQTRTVDVGKRGK